MIFFSNILEIFCSNIFLTGYISGNNTFPQPLDEKEEASFQNKDQLGSLRFEKEYLMFQPDNKKGGIFKMMEILQAPIQDVVVFGDDYNDLDMFDKDLWTGVAMGNACDALKEKATYITDKNVDDGIYNICEKMGWF